ncbi:MAG: hydroxymethylbilane synthase [Gemmatimonadetes bacterium]|nr:hydroxymethylbilane synthase [Gemmatimonadota bacterium]
MSGVATAAVRIGTRSSALALAQAEQVRALLTARGVAAELVTYTTVGDKVLDKPLSQIGEKGLFTKELEDDLLAGRTDCAVHSLKDLPTQSPPGLAIVAHLVREDPRDALVLPATSPRYTLATLPTGARVGSSSLRRKAQLGALRPDLVAVELRGNVGTRLRKIDEGQVDAAFLAAAGLRRLGLGERIVETLDAPQWLPAAGQGAIAIQVRAADAASVATFGALDHAPTSRAIAAERAFLAALEGGCQVPIGALAVGAAPDALVLHGFVADLAGTTVLRGHEPIGAGNAAEAGRRLAAALRARGADAILAGLRTRSA